MGLRRRIADLWQPWQTGHALLAIPLGLIIAITVVDVLLPGDIHLGPLLIVAPAITPWLAGPWLTGLVGALAVAAQAIIAVLRDPNELFSTNHQVQIAALALLSLVIVLFSRQRERRMRQLAQVRSVSEATQRVVLPPLPHRMGPLRIASAYRAADDEALIGGDLYAATRTGNGARLLIGDVRGKGMTAISDASVIMSSFRDAAHRSATLADLAVSLEESMCRHLTEHAPHSEADELYEQFVTVLMLDIPDEDPVAQMINCGHPPPLLLHNHHVTALYPRHTEPRWACAICRGPAWSWIRSPSRARTRSCSTPTASSRPARPTVRSTRSPSASLNGPTAVPRHCCTTSAPTSSPMSEGH